MHRAPPPPDWSKLQKILNQSWPLRDRHGESHARDIPERSGIPVRARIVWEKDGEEYIDGLAQRWITAHVFVAFRDERAQLDGAWLRANDVRRRDLRDE